jgi:hypothetical protein
MKEIKLTHGKVALIDDDDFEIVKQYKWYAMNTNGIDEWYAAMSIKENGKFRITTLHQLIMGRKLIDHIDHNGLNCQKNNMRFCTTYQNNWNSRPKINSKCKYKGVNPYGNKKMYISKIMAKGIQYNLGIYDNEIDAAKAYNKKAIELFGEFAYINKTA